VAARLQPVVGASWAEALPVPQQRPSLLQRWLRFRPSDRRIGALVCFPDDRPRLFAVTRWRADVAWWRDLPQTVLRAYRPLASTWREAIACLEMPQAKRESRSRAKAIALALLLGAFGAHWFYLGRNRRGVVYLLLLPVLLLSAWLGWFDAVRFVWVDREEFERRFAGPTRPAGAGSP
jgi:TM2 domain-containing membrane protein YozV